MTASTAKTSPFPASLLEDPNFEPFDTDQSNSETHALAAHVMIYCRTKGTYNNLAQKAHVLMTLRFDGAIGFPGGLIDPGESVVVALNRECREEIELDAKHILTEADFLCAMLCSRKTSRPLELHSFAKEVTEDEFKEIERRAFHAEDFGQETLGIIRPPLYVQQNGRGLPSFLRNNFAGNAKAQFLYGLISAGILNKEEVEKCLQE